MKRQKRAPKPSSKNKRFETLSSEKLDQNNRTSNKTSNPFHAVILAGGIGRRFWPLSQPDFPKQFLSLFGSRSLIQQTHDRLKPVFGDQIAVCGSQKFSPLFSKHLPRVKKILEPQGRNTAPAIFLSVLSLKTKDTDVIGFFPSDHFIEDNAEMAQEIQKACAVAAKEPQIILMGVIPTHPHPEFGYIEIDSRKKFVRFVEKPSLLRAQEFFRSGTHLWNSGIVIAQKKVLLDAFQKTLPDFFSIQTKDLYSKIEPISFDIGVLQKVRNICVLPMRSGWSDVGSWTGLHQLRKSNFSRGCVILEGRVELQETHNCLIKVEPSLKWRVTNMDNIAIVQNGNEILVTRLGPKALPEPLQNLKPSQTIEL